MVSMIRAALKEIAAWTLMLIMGFCFFCGVVAFDLIDWLRGKKQDSDG